MFVTSIINAMKQGWILPILTLALNPFLGLVTSVKKRTYSMLPVENWELGMSLQNVLISSELTVAPSRSSTNAWRQLLTHNITVKGTGLKLLVAFCNTANTSTPHTTSESGQVKLHTFTIKTKLTWAITMLLTTQITKNTKVSSH